MNPSTLDDWSELRYNRLACGITLGDWPTGVLDYSDSG